MVPLDPILSSRPSSFSDASGARMSAYNTPPITASATTGRSQSDPAFRQLDEGFVRPKRRISFDERVSVREYESNSWINIKDMAELSPIAGCGKRTLIAIPQMIAFPTGCYATAAADACDSTTSTTTNSTNSLITPSLSPMLHREVRSILLVDPHDIFLTLFSKRWKEALPHVNIVTAHSSEEALQLTATRQASFDIIVVEERLSLFHRQQRVGNKLTSGSALISHLIKQQQQKVNQKGLFIGVTAHWQSDHATMVQSGADFCWSKAPPPTLRNNRALLEELLHTLLLKRGKHQLASELMMAPCLSMENLSVVGEDEGFDSKKDTQ
jgi:CheY-like chemotaxis protein